MCLRLPGHHDILAALPLCLIICMPNLPHAFPLPSFAPSPRTETWFFNPYLPTWPRPIKKWVVSSDINKAVLLFRALTNQLASWSLPPLSAIPCHWHFLVWQRFPIQNITEQGSYFSQKPQISDKINQNMQAKTHLIWQNGCGWSLNLINTADPLQQGIDSNLG